MSSIKPDPALLKKYPNAVTTQQLEEKSRFLGTLLGLAAGESLGAGFEFKKAGEFTPPREILGDSQSLRRRSASAPGASGPIQQAGRPVRRLLDGRRRLQRGRDCGALSVVLEPFEGPGMPGIGLEDRADLRQCRRLPRPHAREREPPVVRGPPRVSGPTRAQEIGPGCRSA